jgi:diguanylate cyclase (GGDEF)-like protein/PAS domain S-box-containing protein
VGSSRRSAVLPFAVCTVAGILALLAPPYGHAWGQVLVGCVLLLGIGVLAATLPGPIGSWRQFWPALAYLLVFALLRDASGGGLTPLVALPILWIALYGTRRQLLLIAAATGAVFLLPLVVVGPPDYPLSDWRRAAIWTVVALTVGPLVQRAVSELHTRERDAADAAAYRDAVLRGATEHAIIATSTDGVITMFTEGAERMLGYGADEVVGRMMPSLFHDPLEIADRAAELGVAASDVFTTRAAAGLTETREWTYLRSDGGRLTVRLTVTPLRNADAELIGYIGIAVDVTAERQALQALTAAEHRWRTLLEHLPDTSVLVVGADLRYRVTMGSTHHLRGLGEVAGRSVRETTTPENAALLEPVYLEALTGDVAQAELRSGDDRIVAVEAVPLPEQGDLPEALVVARDVTEQRLREQRLTIAEERFRRLFELAPNGVSVIGMDGRVEQVNRALCEMLGTAAESIVGARIDDLDVATDPASSLQVLDRLAESAEGRVSRQGQVRHSDGHLLDVEVELVLVRTPDGTPEHVLCHLTDVSERRRYEERLAFMADHDPLTGLANRRRFAAELGRHLDVCGRYGATGALLMVDLDNFKAVNDTSGHGAGDTVLAEVAEVLRARLRSSDVVGRLGGDEFAVLLPRADAASAYAVAQDLVDRVRALGRQTADGSGVTASIGVAMVAPGASEARLMVDADLAMYEAKSAGRDRVVLLGSASVSA